MYTSIRSDFTVLIDNCTWKEHLAHSSQKCTHSFTFIYIIEIPLVCSYLLQYLNMILERH